MYNWYDLIRPMELQDAINFLGATQKAYNKNTGEDLSLFEIYDMVEKCAPNVGTNKDYAMLKAFGECVGGKSERSSKKFFEKIESKIDTKAVNQMLKDPALFEDSDEYTMTDEEYEESEYFEEDEYQY
jgi:hypothetical protein